MINTGEDTGKEESIYTICMYVSWFKHYINQYGDASKS